MDFLGETKHWQQDQTHHFYTTFSAVHVISEEEVLLGLCTSESFENVEEIEVLSVDVSEDCDGRL